MNLGAAPTLILEFMIELFCSEISLMLRLEFFDCFVRVARVIICDFKLLTLPPLIMVFDDVCFLEPKVDYFFILKSFLSFFKSINDQIKFFK